MRRTLNILILILFCGCEQDTNRTVWYQRTFREKSLDKQYEVDSTLNPFLIQEDLNGDGVNDVALHIKEKKTGKKGIVILHNKTLDFYVFGAGVDFANCGKDFSWIEKWQLFTDSVAMETQFDGEGNISGEKEIKLRHPGILIEKYEDGAPISGGIIYWMDDKYIWIHQGE